MDSEERERERWTVKREREVDGEERKQISAFTTIIQQYLILRNDTFGN